MSERGLVYGIPIGRMGVHSAEVGSGLLASVLVLAKDVPSVSIR